MKPLKQLLRQPIRTVLALILLTAASAFLCLGWGVLRSAEATVHEINESFVTLAKLGPGYITGFKGEHRYNEETGEEEWVSWEAIGKWETTHTFNGNGAESRTEFKTALKKSDFNDFLESSGCLRGEYQQQFISAYVPGLDTVISADTDRDYTPEKDLPYSRGIVVFTLTEIDAGRRVIQTMTGTAPDGTEIIYGKEGITLLGEAVEYPLFRPEYEARETIELLYTFHPDDRDAVMEMLEVGKRYIVNVVEYEDKDLALRTDIAGIPGVNSAAEVDWGGLALMKGEWWWRNEDGVGRTLFDTEMAKIGVGYAATPYHIFDPCEYTANIAPLEGTLEEFLADEANARWVEMFDLAQKQYSTVPVLGTDLLKSMYIFHEDVAYITSGRSFVSTDYTEGKRVCIISETLAQANGLKVGDKLDLSFYEGALEGSTLELEDYYTCFHAGTIDGDTVFSSAREYEIIGLYANTREWKKLEYSFSPNTIIVPSESLAGLETQTARDYLTGLVVQDGTPEKITAASVERGWPSDLLVFFDSGYSKIANVMENFTDSPQRLFQVACAAFVVILIAYVALFVMRQRRNAGMMLSLGAGRGRTALFVLVTSWVPAALSSAVGAVLGALLLNRTVNSVIGDTLVEAGFADRTMVMPSAVLTAALAMLAVTFVVLGIVSLILSRRRPLKLMKK